MAEDGFPVFRMENIIETHYNALKDVRRDDDVYDVIQDGVHR